MQPNEKILMKNYSTREEYVNAVKALAEKEVERGCKANGIFPIPRKPEYIGEAHILTAVQQAKEKWDLREHEGIDSDEFHIPF